MALTRSRLIQLFVAGLCAAPVLAHLLWGERSAIDTGPRALLDACFALALAATILITALGWGRLILHRLDLTALTAAEVNLFSMAIGLGVLGYGVLALGLMGLLHPWAIGAWLAASMLITRRTWRQAWTAAPTLWPRVQRSWRGASNFQRALVVIAVATVGLALLQALTPVWDYDGQMYHLQGPRLWLQAGRITLLPDVWQANGPATLDLVYAIGLAFDADTAAKVLHLACGVLVAGAAFTFARRFLSPTAAWLALAILLTAPMMPLVASWAYTDLGWALYEFLALYAVILIGRSETAARSDLVLAGLCAGLALGLKYQAAAQAGLLAIYIMRQARGAGWRQVIGRVMVFGATAAVVAAPWYLKNWALSGNPIYPFVWGGPGWDQRRLDMLFNFLNGFGPGHAPIDYLLLPVRVYVQRATFTTAFGGMEWPSVFFLLIGLYPLRWWERPLRGVLVLTLARCVVWAAGSQQLRFMIPVFPALSVLTAEVMTSWIDRSTGLRSRLTQGVTLTLAAVTPVMLALFSAQFPPLAVLMGTASKADFLGPIGTYRALQFAQARLSPDQRLMMMWDGRGYYCDQRCLADPEQSQWTQVAAAARFDVTAVTAALRARGFTHLLFAPTNADFIIQRDPGGQHRLAAEFFVRRYAPQCGRLLYRDLEGEVYEITCQ
jgi:hypothetical protein